MSQPSIALNDDLIGTSYSNYRQRYNTAASTTRYPSTYRNTWKDQADLRAILRGLAGVAAGSRVLDLPCGAGRLTVELLRRGYAVTAVDVSTHMLARARDNVAAAAGTVDPSDARFQTGDVMQTGFEAKSFDAVVCSRLFHHFTEAEVRRSALCELARICRGPIVVSFSNRFALDTFGSRLKQAFRLRLGRKAACSQPADGASIRLAEFISDGQAAGLAAERAIATRWGLSPLWYVVFRAE